MVSANNKSIIPLSSAGLDSGHAVAGSECVGCHATLDPMRNFWANQYDFNDRNDFPGPATRGAPTNARPCDVDRAKSPPPLAPQ